MSSLPSASTVSANTNASAATATPQSRLPTRRNFLSMIAGGVLGAVGGAALTNRVAQTQLNAPIPTLPNVAQVPPTTITTTDGMRVHVIQTGFVAVKQAHRQLTGVESARLLSIAADTQWTTWMPIQTWVIEHPKGIIVVDTGETSRVHEPNYFDCDPITSWVYRNNLRFAVTPGDEIATQLQTLNLDPADVKIVVQTHLHGDHIGGLGSFPNAEVFVPKEDYPNSMGTLSCHYPANFAPSFADFTKQDLPGIERGYRLTDDGDVWIIPTPGHSLGHQSVLLQTGTVDYLFLGDASFDDIQLRDGLVGGIVEDVGLARTTLTHLQTLIRERPTVYLPTHDPNARRRLTESQITQL